QARPPRHEALEAHGPRTADAGARAVPQDARDVEGRSQRTAQAVARDDAGAAPPVGRAEPARGALNRPAGVVRSSVNECPCRSGFSRGLLQAWPRNLAEAAPATAPAWISPAAVRARPSSPAARRPSRRRARRRPAAA